MALSSSHLELEEKSANKRNTRTASSRPSPSLNLTKNQSGGGEVGVLVVHFTCLLGVAFRMSWVMPSGVNVIEYFDDLRRSLRGL